MDKTLTYPSLIQIMTFPFTDPHWLKKGLVGILLILIGPVTCFIPWVFVAGYCYRIVQQTISGDIEIGIPEWDNWGKLFLDGIRLIGAGLIYTAPVVVMFMIGFAGLLAFPAMLDAASQSNNPFLGIIPISGLGFGWLFYGTGLLLLFIIGLFLPAPLCHLVAKNSFSAAFQLDEWWKIYKANLGEFLVSFLFLMGFSMVFYFVTQVLYFTFIFCFISPLIVSSYSFYLYLITSTLYAYSYRQGQNRISTLPSEENPF